MTPTTSVKWVDAYNDALAIVGRLITFVENNNIMA